MSNKKGNLFGGANPLGQYVPMSPDEIEVLHRLKERNDLQVVVHGWGYVDRPRLVIGDGRVAVNFRLVFDKPAFPMPVTFFDLELRTRAGLTLARERLPSIVNGKPVQVAAGMFLDLVWDMAIHSMDPKLVKMIKPGARGLTSRRQDKDTGEMTAQGNMKLNSHQKRVLAELEEGYARMKAEDLKQQIKATKMAGQEVKRTAKGFEAEDL